MTHDDPIDPEPHEGMEVAIRNGDRGAVIFFDTITHVTRTAFVTDTGRRFSRTTRRETGYTRWPATVYLHDGDGWAEVCRDYRLAQLRNAARGWGRRVVAEPSEAHVLAEASRQLGRIAELVERESQP